MRGAGGHSLALAAPGAAEEGKFALGLRTDLGLGSGKPSNDIPGYGLYGLYELNDRWNIGFAVDSSPKFDFERTPDVLGLVTPEVVDAIGDSTTLSGCVEGVLRKHGGRLEWFWKAGVGLNMVNMKDVAGALVDGGTYDIRTDTGSEFQIIIGGGVRRWIGSNWGVEFALQRDQHLADWKLADRVSGRTGMIGDYEVNSINIGFLRRFGGSRP